MAKFRRTSTGEIAELTLEEEAALDQMAIEAAAQYAARIAEEEAQQVLQLDLKADAIFDQLKTATSVQINTYVNNTFGNLNVTQRAVIKLLLQYVALQLRKES